MNNPQAETQARIREVVGDLTIQNISLEFQLRAAHAEINRLMSLKEENRMTDNQQEPGGGDEGGVPEPCKTCGKSPCVCQKPPAG